MVSAPAAVGAAVASALVVVGASTGAAVASALAAVGAIAAVVGAVPVVALGPAAGVPPHAPNKTVTRLISSSMLIFLNLTAWFKADSPLINNESDSGSDAAS